MPGDLIQTPQTRWIQGAYESVQRGGPILLVALVTNGVAEARYSALRQPGAAAGYQVTAGKTLWLTEVILSSTTSSNRWRTGTGTADAGSSQVAAPAGEAAIDSEAIGVRNHLVVTSAEVVYRHNIILQVGSLLYPFIKSFASSSSLYLTMLGHEE